MARVFQKGFQAIVLKGRRKGQTLEITEIVDDNFLKVKNAKGKERRMNVKHLKPA